MKLIIDKFLPINQRCEIDLSKKMTLFVGMNNSGKTYLSQFIWGIYNTNLHNMLLGEKINSDDLIDEKNLLELTENRTTTFSLDENLVKTISKNYTDYLKQYRIKEIFKQDMDVDFSFTFNQEEITHMNYGFIDKFNVVLDPQTPNITITYLNNYKEIVKDNNKQINQFLQYTILHNLFKPETTYMPATRLFFPSFYKYIRANEKTMLDKVADINTENKSFFAPSYTEPVDDLVNKLTFNLEKIQENEYIKIISSIMEGDITVDKSEEISMAMLSYIPKASTEKLSMHMSSSMVNQLSMIYLYFKYWYKENSFLLLDEPEMNLHPVKKIEFLELLLKFASKNKVLIATHSNTIAKTLINYMHLFDLKKEKNIDSFLSENDMSMKSDIDLISNDIAIYFFNGKTIVPYKKDNDSNIHFGTFSDIEKMQEEQYEQIKSELRKNDTR